MVLPPRCALSPRPLLALQIAPRLTTVVPEGAGGEHKLFKNGGAATENLWTTS